MQPPAAKGLLVSAQFEVPQFFFGQAANLESSLPFEILNFGDEKTEDLSKARTNNEPT